MTLSIYKLSVPVYVRGLNVLSGLLAKGAAHAAEQGSDPAALLTASLAPDMANLISQVQRVSDTSKGAIERLSGTPAPKMPDEEATFDELQARVAKTIAFINSVDPALFDGAEDRTITLTFGEWSQGFTGESFLLTFALPNFYFHLVTAYGVLRSQGVNVGKLDYLGGL